MRNNRTRFIFYISILLGTIFLYLGSPISPVIYKSEIPFSTGLLLLPFTAYGLFFYCFAMWMFVTRNNDPMTRREEDWGDVTPLGETNNEASWPLHQQRLHAKMLNSDRDFSAAYPYDKEKCEAGIAKMEREMAEVRLKCFGPPKGVWKKETIEEKVERLTASGVPCEIAND
jgi:hypothetical protein